MGFIYKIEVGENLYIGSTKHKLCDRQARHNYILNNPNDNNYNLLLYRFFREHNIEKIICELIETVDNSELRILEQEYINMLEPKLNTNRAYRTKEEKKEYEKKYKRKTDKIKGNCPICNKLMTKKYINTHINTFHKTDN